MVPKVPGFPKFWRFQEFKVFQRFYRGSRISIPGLWVKTRFQNLWNPGTSEKSVMSGVYTTLES